MYNMLLLVALHHVLSSTSSLVPGSLCLAVMLWMSLNSSSGVSAGLQSALFAFIVLSVGRQFEASLLALQVPVSGQLIETTAVNSCG